MMDNVIGEPIPIHDISVLLDSLTEIVPPKLSAVVPSIGRGLAIGTIAPLSISGR